jgi:hypothetical protein
MHNSIWRFIMVCPVIGIFDMRFQVGQLIQQCMLSSSITFVFKNTSSSKEKKLQTSLACTKNYSNCAECCTKKFAGHYKGKQAEQVNKAGRLSSKTSAPAKHKKSSGSCNHVSLTDKCPIHPDGNHIWGNCYQNILNKDKKFPAKGSSKWVKTCPLMR